MFELPKPEIKNDELSYIEKPMFHLFEQMLPNVEKGEYDLVIGIDASGRIPTFIIDKMINYVYTKKNTGYEFKTRFIAGAGNNTLAGTDGYSWEKEERRKQVINLDNELSSKIKDLLVQWSPKKKVLIIDDFFQSGTSLRPLIKALNQLGIHYDLGILGHMGAYGNEKDIKIQLRGNYPDIFQGDDSTFMFPENVFFGNAGDALIHKTNLSGVTKSRGDLFSKVHSQSNSDMIQARSDANIIVEHLIDQYESK